MLPPFKIQRILFPTDFSNSSERTAEHVLGLAKATDAEVCLLHVVPWLAAWHGVSEPYFDLVGKTVSGKLEESQAAAEAAAAELVARFCDKHFQNVKTRTHVSRGGVAESIVEYANEVEA